MPNTVIQETIEPTLSDDRNAIRDLSYLYATAVDSRDYPLFEVIVSEDARLFGEHFSFNGIDEIIGGMAIIETYKTTFHAVHNQLITLHDHEAEGEIYCVASHIFDKEGVEYKLDWGIRYRDQYRRTALGWRIVERELIVDWTQELPTGAEL